MSVVQIVIPTYNAQGFIAECLDSLINQTEKNWKAIIVDDGSSDNTPAIATHYAEKDPRFQIHCQQNAGVAAARNNGMQLADLDSEFILFLDNDDFLLPNCLETLLQALQEQPNAVAAYGLSRDVNKEGTYLTKDINKSFGYCPQKVGKDGLVDVQEGDLIGFSTMVVWPCIQTPGQILMRMSSVKTVEGFDQKTVPSDDWDICVRLSAIGDFVLVKEFVMSKRCHDHNVSSNGKLMAATEPIIRGKLATSTFFTPEQRKIARAGHLNSCLVKVSWAKSDLKNGHLLNAMKQLYRSAKSYAAFRGTRYIGA